MNSKLLRQIIIMSKYSLVGIIMQFMVYSLASGDDTMAQKKSVNDIKIDLMLKSASIEQIFSEISIQTGFDFHFEGNSINVTETVSLNKKSTSVGDVLRLMSKRNELNFRRVDEDIFVKRAEGVDQTIDEVYQGQIRIAVSGKVTDGDNGDPLPGVNIVVKGTTTGTVTDVEGSYSIEAESTSTLVFSYIGFELQEVVVGSRSVIDIQLTPDINQLAEIVVTGYTSQSRRSITGAIETIGAAELARNPATNVEQRLQGKVSGVNVITSGAPGSPVQVRIRGYGTTGDNNPLYVIDGTPSENSLSLNEINPDDIESISVIKDASAASIYGARAANGVVLITTKKGTKGQAPRVTYSSYVSIDIDPSNINQLNSQQWGDLEFQGQIASGLDTASHPSYGLINPVIPQYLNGDPSLPYNAETNRLIRSADTDWQKELQQTGVSHSHNISVLGGGENSRYNLSFGYLNREGTVIETSYQRYTTRVNTEFSAINNRIRIGENLSVSYSEQNGSVSGTLERYRYHPLIPVLDEGGNFGGTLNGVLGLQTNARNPVAVQERFKNSIGRTQRVFGNAYLEGDITTDLTFKTSIGIDNIQRNDSRFSPEFPEGGNPGNSLTEFSRRYTSVTWTNTLNYGKDFGDHSINVLAGTEAITRKRQDFEFFGTNFFSEDPAFSFIDGAGSTDNVTGSATERRLSSLFGKIDYSFQDRYLLNFTIRRDGASVLGPTNRTDVFPAFGVGWVISDEAFLQGNATISLLKLRAGWGKTGNVNSIPTDNDFAFASRFALDERATGYDISATNAGYSAGIALLGRGNDALIWESSETLNIGLDFSLLDNRISGSFEWYNRKTLDMLVQPQPPFASGVAEAPFVNLGEIENKGVDVTLGYNGQLGPLTLGVTGIVSAYKNEVIKLDNNPETFLRGGGGNPAIFTTRTLAGHPFASFYGMIVDGVIQSGADAGNFDFRDVSGDGTIDPNEDSDFIGSPHPDYTYSLNITAGYKNFDFTAFLRGSQGNDVWQWSKVYTDFQFREGTNRSTRVLNAWTAENPTNKLAEFNLNTATDNLRSSSYYVEDGSYLKLQTLQVGYTLPQIKGISKLRVYLQGQNLFTATSYSGIDPEILETNNDLEIGVDRGNTYVVPRTYLLGLNVTF